MKSRFVQFLVAELIAFGALFFGGLALLGAAVTWTGRSQHSAFASWILVAVFAAVGFALGRVAAIRMRRVFVQPN